MRRAVVMRCEIGTFRNDDETAPAEGHFVHVHVDRRTRRRTTLPPPLRVALTKIAAD